VLSDSTAPTPSSWRWSRTASAPGPCCPSNFRPDAARLRGAARQTCSRDQWVGRIVALRLQRGLVSVHAPRSRSGERRAPST
jgi:hypothetical protein